MVSLYIHTYIFYLSEEVSWFNRRLFLWHWWPARQVKCSWWVSDLEIIKSEVKYCLVCWKVCVELLVPMTAMFCLQRWLFPVSLLVKGRIISCKWCSSVLNPVSELRHLLTSAKSLTEWLTLCVLPHCSLHFHCSGKMKHCNWLEKGNPPSFRNVVTSPWMFPHVVSESFKYIYLPYTFVILT